MVNDIKYSLQACRNLFEKDVSENIPKSFTENIIGFKGSNIFYNITELTESYNKRYS